MSSDANLSLKKFIKFYVDFNDTKENERYLISFKVTTISSELKVYITNGDNQWFININDKISTTIQQNVKKSAFYGYTEFLDNLYNVLIKKQFNLQKIYNTDESSTLIKFETSNASIKQQINFFLKLNDNYNAIDCLKFICFNLYEKCNQLEDELRKQNIQQSSSRIESDAAASDPIRKQNVASIVHAQRKAGMSIINPNSRKRKIPKGVQFGDNDDDDDSSSSS